MKIDWEVVRLYLKLAWLWVTMRIVQLLLITIELVWFGFLIWVAAMICRKAFLWLAQ